MGGQSHLQTLHNIGVTKSNDFHVGQLDFKINRIAVALGYSDAIQVEWIEAFDTCQTRNACNTQCVGVWV